jgi:two-component system CheB/CheR fusion protein
MCFGQISTVGARMNELTHLLSSETSCHGHDPVIAAVDLTALTSQIYLQSGAAMLITDHDFSIVSINPAFTQATHFNLATLKGQSVTMICEDLLNSVLYEEIQTNLRISNEFSGELVITSQDMQAFPVQVLINGLQYSQNITSYYVWLMLDISEQKQRENELRFHAEIDPLTHLGNRKSLFQCLDAAIASAKRFKYTIALLFLDLDGFKQVNDHFGHGEGDKVLQEVALRLKRCVREVDTVTRLGGDEFVVILNGTSKDMICLTAQRIIDFLTLSVKNLQKELQVSASIGIALYPQDSKNPLLLLKYADEAMYKAKAKGKRQFCWHLET